MTPEEIWAYAQALSRFRADYSRLLASAMPTERMVDTVAGWLEADGPFAGIAEDAKLWLVMEHGLDIDRWNRRRKHRNGDGGSEADRKGGKP